MTKQSSAPTSDVFCNWRPNYSAFFNAKAPSFPKVSEITYLCRPKTGDLSEWLKEQAWKVCIRVTVSRVRISQSPQKSSFSPFQIFGKGFLFQQKLPTMSPSAEKNWEYLLARNMISFKPNVVFYFFFCSFYISLPTIFVSWLLLQIRTASCQSFMSAVQNADKGKYLKSQLIC